jgi:hypothetical protein
MVATFDPGARRLGVELLLLLALTVWLAGMADDWWGGHAFGGRRLVALSITYGVGLAVVADRCIRHRSFVVRIAALVVALALFRLHLTLGRDYMQGRIARGIPVSFEPAMRRAFGPAGTAMHEWLGNPGAVPASWVFALRHRISPGRWDTTVGWTLVRSKSRTRGWDRLKIDDERWALRGLAVPRRPHAHRCRKLTGPVATVAVPLRAALAMQATARLHADGEGARVHVAVGSTTVAQRDLRPGWHDETWTIPASATHAGVNLVTMHRFGDPALCWAWLQLVEEGAEGPPRPPKR